MFQECTEIFIFSCLVTVEKDVGCWVKVEKDTDSISVAVFSFSVYETCWLWVGQPQLEDEVGVGLNP